MTLIDSPTALSSTPTERTERLATAVASWGSRITADPANGHLTYRVQGRGEGSIASAITAGKHHFLIDEPAALAGDDLAASPVEIALGALISCQIVVFRLYAHTLGIQLDDISVAAEGDLDAGKLFGIDESVRAGFSDIRLTVTLTGPESDERYQELRDVVDKHCPVLDLFVNRTPVSVAVVKA